ncbi:hypothetical protein GQ53DRAFT_828710 [Thozetella sp. PMI_491]|nr:hypothetical protein GQ53DRAFT_828710 [Thozetella sp. PMI_491]
MAARIHRVTMFKIPSEEHQKLLLEAYKVLAKDQNKDGKPYILYMAAGPVIGDPRNKGYTLVAKSEFANLEDLKFYDEACAAHGALKKVVGTFGMQEPPLTVYFEGSPVINLPNSS